jgi:CheY-specific phosphatase CheX
MQVRVTEDNIQNASAQFWEQMLAMRLEPICSADSAKPVLGSAEPQAESSQIRCIGPQHVVGSCDLAGVWVGRIEVRLSQGLAIEATAAMLMQSAASVEACDTIDATKEIANMIAGTIKSALPRPCTMTVPSANVETADFCIPQRTRDSVTVFFQHAAGELMIRVWQEALEQENENSVKKELSA